MSFTLPIIVKLPRFLEPYRDAISWKTRVRVAGLLTAPARALRELRWRTSDLETIARWTDARLNLGDFYWLFVLGLNNSGTTMLARVLATHPLIRSLPGEGAWLTSAFPGTREHGVGRVFTERPEVFRWDERHDPVPALRARFDWAYHYEKRPGVLLEKSPQHMVRSAWIQLHFRPVRFLVITRNPYAVCEGIQRRGGRSIERAAHHWTRGHEILLDDLVLIERYQMISYEGFCAEPELHLERIRQFLGFDTPFDASVLRQPVRAPTVDRKPRPIQDQNAASIARLSRQDIATITRIAGPVMQRLGYQCL